jgi:hypothetical protein
MGEKRKLSALVLAQQDALQRQDASHAEAVAKLQRVINSALPFIADWADRCAACDLFRDMNHVTPCQARDCFKLYCEQCSDAQLCDECGMCTDCCAEQQCPPWVCAHCLHEHAGHDEHSSEASEGDVNSDEDN